MKRIAESVETSELCHYGCGSVAKFKNGSGNLMCLSRSNSCPSIRKKNSDKIKHAHADGRIPNNFGDNQGWAKGLFAATDSRIKNKKYDIDSVFTIGGLGPHKSILIQERGHKCEFCGLGEWLSNPIPLELDHIDGNNQDNRKINLRLLCPNCHSTTPTYRGRGVNTGRKTVSDEDLLMALLRNEFVVSKALLEVHMTPKGGNFSRCYDLITQYKLMSQ